MGVSNHSRLFHLPLSSLHELDRGDGSKPTFDSMRHPREQGASEFRGPEIYTNVREDPQPPVSDYHLTALPTHYVSARHSRCCSPNPLPVPRPGFRRSRVQRI